MKAMLIFGILMFYIVRLNAQDTTQPLKNIHLNGYASSLSMMNHYRQDNGLKFDQVLQCRFNASLNVAKYFRSVFEIRSRWFWGDMASRNPSFQQSLANTSERLDLSFFHAFSHNAVVYANVERASMEYEKEKWRIKIGRQRINWGMTNSWNPNDIFNAYNMLDVDYPERAGTDAIFCHYQYETFKSFESAIAWSKSGNDINAALKYSFNKNAYDWQIISGLFERRYTLGIGWQGSIGNVGFKGETQFFTHTSTKKSVLNLCLEFDQLIGENWFLNGAVLYNESGRTRPFENRALVSFKNNPENLMPTKFNVLLGARKEFTPLFQMQFNLICAPSTGLIVLLPTLSFNLLTELDLDCYFQSTFLQEKKYMIGVSNAAFIRLKRTF